MMGLIEKYFNSDLKDNSSFFFSELCQAVLSTLRNMTIVDSS